MECVTIAYNTIPYGPFLILQLRTFYLPILSAMLPLFKIVKICNIQKIKHVIKLYDQFKIDGNVLNFYQGLVIDTKVLIYTL
jgi:hypothetical protein